MRIALALAAALTLGASTASAQLTFTLASDAEYLDHVSQGLFTKRFGGQARAGNGRTNGDWEYAVVNATTSPISPVGQKAWAGAHSYSFSWDGALSATMNISGGASGPRTSNTVPAGLPVNAVYFRARNGAGTVGSFSSDILVQFQSGGSVTLDGFAGDNDAQYLALVDSRLGGGFTITGEGTISGRNAGSVPMYEFKVGQSAVVTPEPSTYALMAAGLAALGTVARRRRAVA